MKPVSIIVGALAALATAAPTEKRGGGFDGLNNFNFGNDNFAYLASIGGLDFQLLAQLGSINQFNVFDNFNGLFNSNNFGLAQLLQFQQLQTFLQFAQLGVFNQFDLASLQFNALNLGLINNIGGFDVNSLINGGLTPQIQAVIQSNSFIIKE